MTKHLDILKEKREELDKAIQEEQNKKISTKGELKFYEFTQNNSGGNFTVNEKLCHRLLIQAHNYEEARKRAMNLGVYFDGCSNGMDCSCCGDRWSDNEHLVELPNRYGAFTLDQAIKSGIKHEPTTWKRHGLEEPDKNKYDLIFETIEEYANYLVNEYSYGSSPECRIFYYNGKVKEIFYEK